jgi:hypothetical protein
MSLTIPIVGTAPFVFNKFSAEAREKMRSDQAAGSAGKTKVKGRPPKDFEAGAEGSVHRDVKEGWAGIPCTAFKSAMITAGGTVGEVMKKLKQIIFIEADGINDEGQHLVKVTGEPAHVEHYTRNQRGGADIRPRGMLAPGWKATLRFKYDADFITPESIANLLLRAGISVGVGAGRPASTMSCGMGWGTFEPVRGKQA